MESLFKPLYLPGADQTKLNPSFSDIMSSAFNLESDVVNVYDALTRPVFEPDPDFDFKTVFKESQLPIDWMPIVATAQSKAEFDLLVGRAQKEYKDKAVLAASGFTGTLAALGAGMLSPTVFIPFSGQARGAKGMAQILGLAAAGAGAQNGALFYNQATRTEGELYAGIAMDTLLMGMMGGAYMGLTRGAKTQLARDIKFNEKKVEVPQGALDTPNGVTTPVRVDTPEASEVKREVRELGIRNPDEVQEMLDEAGVGDTFVPLRDRALQIGEIKRSRAKDAEEQLANGKTFLEVPIAQGVVARFVKVPAGSGGKWFTDNEYSISLRAEDGSEIVIPSAKVDSHAKAGATQIYKEADLKQAIVDGKLDDQFYEMLEVADDTGMARSSGEATISTSKATDASAAGAQVTKQRNTLGAKAAPNRVRQAAMNALGRMSPSYRMLTQKFFPSLRHGIAKLDMSGVQQAGLARVEGSARGGTVIERIRGYDYNIVKFAKALDKNFYRYIHGTDEGFDFGSPAITQLKSMMGRMPQGKMNWSQYKEAVFDGLNTGEVSKDIADSVAAFKEFFENYTTRQKQYIAEMKAAGIDVPPLFKELMSDELGEGIENYAHHIFSKKVLMEKAQEFYDDFAGYNEKSLMESFAKARVRYAKRKAKLEFEKLVAEMDPAQISARLDEVESDLEFLEELPEWQAFRQKRLDLNKMARDEGWPKEKLKEEQKKLQESLTPEVQQLQKERKDLMAAAKVYRNFGGDATEKTAKLQAEIDKADELISGMFRTELPGIERVDLSIGKIQKQSDAALKAVNTGLAKIIKTLNARQARMTKLLRSTRANTASRAKVAELIAADKLKYDAMLVRLEAVNGQQVAFDDRLKELWNIREVVIADATRLVKKRAAKVEDLEDRLEAATAKVVTPEERSRMQAQIGDDIDRLEGDFRQLWSERGERSGDPVTTEAPDFKDKAKEMAIQLHQKLMGTEIELSPAYHALRQDARGAELLRVMKIPYEIKNKWLEKDVEVVTRAYDRVMAPDLEIWRAFDGSVNATSLLGEMQEEAIEHLTRISASKYVKLPKGWTDKAAKFSDRVKKVITEVGEADDIYIEASSFSDVAKPGFIELTPALKDQLSLAVNDALKASKRDVDVAIQRLRATRGVPQDPGSLMWRSGKFVKALNVTTMMGGVLTSSISDIARPIWRHGVVNTFRHGWKPFLDKMNPQAKAFRLRSKEINQRIGLNLEPMLHSRAQGVFDLAEDTLGRTRIERGAQLLANKTGLVAMYDYWTAGMKTISGNVVHATMAEYVPAVAAAWRNGVEPTGDLLQMRTYLRNMGLTDLDIHRIATQMEQPGGMETFSNGGVLPNIDKWDDPAAYQAYQAAITKEVNELIVTPGLERPNWTDENMAYSLVAQFKSFTFSSTSRMAMSGLQGNDPYLMQGIAFSLAFGALSYYAYAVSAGGKTLEEASAMDPDKWLWESVKRSGVLGAISLGTDAAGNIPGLSGKEPTIFTKPSGLLGVFLGPTYSQAEKMATAITQINSDNPDQQARNMRSLRQVWVPYQNHFLFRQLFDRVGATMFGG